jgi:hypothetical protein
MYKAFFVALAIGLSVLAMSLSTSVTTAAEPLVMVLPIKFYAPWTYDETWTNEGGSFYNQGGHTQEFNSKYAVDFSWVEGETKGQPVLASADGKVLKACADRSGCGTGRNGGLGIHVVLQHSHGLQTLYAHLDSLRSSLKVGMPVWHGYQIGKAGCSGWCTDPHLHFGIWKCPSGALAPGSACSSVRPDPLDGQRPEDNGRIKSHNFFGITIYDDVGYAAPARNMRSSDNDLRNDDLGAGPCPSSCWSDRIHSIQIRAGCYAILYENEFYNQYRPGASLMVKSRIPDLSQFPLGDGRNWADQATSIKVFCK